METAFVYVDTVDVSIDGARQEIRLQGCIQKIELPTIAGEFEILTEGGLVFQSKGGVLSFIDLKKEKPWIEDKTSFYREIEKKGLDPGLDVLNFGRIEFRSLERYECYLPLVIYKVNIWSPDIGLRFTCL